MKIYCGTYKTKGGAERYITRQSALSQQVDSKDSSGNYTIQPTVVRKSQWVAGPQFFVTFKVYHEGQVTA